MEYLLDTCTAVYLATNSNRLPDNIREDIEYFQHQYHISIISVMEALQLMQLGKIEIRSLNAFTETLERFNISIDPISIGILHTLEKIGLIEINGRQHSDPTDRVIIAQAIHNNLTLVSCDQKFPYYHKYGLSLVEF